MSIKNKQSIKFYRLQNAPSKENAVAYCHCATHVGYLSPTLLKAHKCLEKQCPFLEKHENKTFWVRRDVINVLRKHNKCGRRGIIMINGKQYLTDSADKLVSVCLSHISQDGKKPVIEYIV